MKVIKVMIVFGTRPEAIKMAPIILELRKRKNIKPIVCVTAQHREMLDQVLKVFDIKPDYDLNIMKQGQSLSEITSKSLIGLEQILQEIKPNIVLVHGDTTTAFAAALASFYKMVDIGHVEAGLRTRNKYSPFPEEMNRRIIDAMADMFFAPTKQSYQNLIDEGVENNKIEITGNTAIDTMKLTIRNNYSHEIIDWVGRDRLILLTSHRRENLGEPMQHIFKAIKKIITKHENVKVVFPMHMNIKVREIAKEIFGNCDRIKLIEPLEVIDFHNLINKAYIILTDSGGIQEEAPFLGKPVLVLRNTTERPEGVEAGTLKLVGTNEKKVYEEIEKMLKNDKVYKEMSMANNPYGDGNASIRIVDSIIKKYN
ncbi:MAG: UDP-N-acetylglucosamine 2-epimerase (non-hydrolyzing) [Clostridia bacterium]